MPESHPTDWFRDARWGVMLHYLSRPPGASPGTAPEPEFGAAQWNERIERFDVARLARQLAELGAGYLLISVGQNCGYYLAPNAAYDGIVGGRPSTCATRDLVVDLHAALEPRGIRLMAYLPCHPPAGNIPVLEKFACTPDWENREAHWCGLTRKNYTVADGVDERLSQSQKLWNAVIREWAERWGPRVAGWWVDGGHHADLMFDHPDEPNFQGLANALKAGNPDRIIALASGKIDSFRFAPTDDYTAGEMGAYLRVHPVQRWIDGIQYHTLNTLGSGWGANPPRYHSGAFPVAFTREVNRHAGVVTWDIPPAVDGTLPDVYMEQLRGLRADRR